MKKGSCLRLDFEGLEDLLSEIKNIAKMKFRTPERQVLYWISQAVQMEKNKGKSCEMV